MSLLTPERGPVATLAPPDWFWWLFLAVPAVMLVVGVLWLLRTVPRVRRALHGEGVVVDVGRQSMYEGRRLWRLTVEYRDVEGRVQQGVWAGDSTVDQTLYQPGMRVPVRYDPEQPGWVHLPGSGRPHPYLVPGGLVVVGGLVMALVLVLRQALG